MRRVVAFGSRATWTAKEYSDLDLAVLGDEPLPLDAAAALAEGFGESDLPFKVDVVVWADIDDHLRGIIRRDAVDVQTPEASAASTPGPPSSADRLHLSARHRRVLEALLREHLPDVEVWAYGSRVNGRSHTGSDLGLVLRGPGLQKIPAEQLADIADSVRESAIPFLVEARDWTRLPERLQREIGRNHEVLVNAAHDAHPRRPRVALGDLIDLRLSSVDKKSRPDEIPVRLCNYTDVYYNTAIRQNMRFMEATASAREIAKCALSSGDVVITKDSEQYDDIGVPAFVMDDMPSLVCGYHLAILRPDATRIQGRYLFYALNTHDAQTQFHYYANGTTRFGLRKADIGLIEIPLPCLGEQQAIAQILGTLDDKIELNRRMNETLEAMARALFKSWFVDFEPVRAKMKGRDPSLPQPLADLFPDRLVDSEAGEIPEGWEVRPLGGQVTVSKGLSYKGAGLTTPDCGIPLHNLNSIKEGGGYKPDGLKYYSGKFRQRYIVKPGNLIVANTEQGFEHLLIGYSAIIPEWSAPEALFSHHIFLIEMMPESPLSELWLHYAISASWMGDAIRRFSNGTTVNMLPADAFCHANTIVASRKVIDAFCRIVDPMLKQQERAVVRSRNLAALRDRLLPKLISGDIRVRDAEQEAEAVV